LKSQKVINMILMSFSLVLLLLLGLSNIAVGKSPLHAIAIKGYDTVAYFKNGKALQGNESFTFQRHDMSWYFLNKENRDLFAKSPEKYAPQYDGYCAWAMTEARKAQTDPKVWKIVNGKLYLNCSRAAYEKWSRDIPGNIKKADMNWLKFVDKN
jgi:YHS domain-containing protein